MPPPPLQISGHVGTLWRKLMHGCIAMQTCVCGRLYSALRDLHD